MILNNRRMQLEKNEYTITTLIEYLNKNYKKKSGKPFNHSDISQYLIRGYLPYRYGGELLTIKTESGIKVIVLNANKTK